MVADCIKYIPEFRNPKVVIKSPTSDREILVSAKSEITIRQLLNPTSGITNGEGTEKLLQTCRHDSVTSRFSL